MFRQMQPRTLSVLPVLCLLSICFASSAPAQLSGRKNLPDQSYYFGFNKYYQADYKDALSDFERGERGAMKIGQDRFLDSICYWTMMGECYYHMGDYAQAVELYERSLSLYLVYNKDRWQERLTSKPIQPSTSAIQQANVTWYTSNRTNIANIPGSFTMLFGRLDASRALQEGGVVQNAELQPVDVAEIMRCTALALHRRRLIKGPICKFDPFTTGLITGLSAAPRTGTEFGQWNKILGGLAQASAENYAKAAQDLVNGLQLMGGMDHQLTPIALLTLAQIAMAEGKNDEAAKLALEASYSAAVWHQFDLIEESLSLATTIHLISNKSLFAPLEPAVAWASREKANLLHASLLKQVADCYVEAGNAAAASNALELARKPMARNSLSQAVIGNRMQYLRAAISFLNGDSKQGLVDLANSLKKFQMGSRWVYQLGLANSLVAAGSVSERQADLIYQQLLRDPTATEWKIDPMETMAFLTSPHLEAMERWFEILIARRDFDLALDVSELLRRHRFFASLPLGGRMLAFRWMLHGPDRALSQESINQRREFYAAYPEYKALADQSDALIEQLRKLPLKPDADSDESKQQRQLMIDLFGIATRQELMLASLAMRRVPADLVFPPSATYSDLKSNMGAKQIALVSLETNNGYHQFALSQQNRRYLGMVSKRDMRKGISGLLKDLGISDDSGGLDIKTLEDTSWKPSAHELLKKIFVDVEDSQWSNFEELVIVPDGLLWYLPFEVLQTGTEESNFKNLSDQIKIRYSPTLNLAYAPQRVSRDLQRTAAVSARFHPKGDPESATKSFEELTKNIPTAVNFTDRVEFPSNLLGAITDQMLVWSDLKTTDRDGVYTLMPIQIDRSKKGKGLDGSSLLGWMSLPWQGPDSMILPGFTSGGAAGIKKENGEDLFLTTTALLASGVRTLLISRWRVGGQNDLELTREFAVRSRTESAIDAWTDSVKMARGLDLDLAEEPRIKFSQLAMPLKAEHPFFWAGHILIDVPTDSGPSPAASDPVLNPLQQNPIQPGPKQIDKPEKNVPEEKDKVADDGQPKTENKSDNNPDELKTVDTKSLTPEKKDGKPKAPDDKKESDKNKPDKKGG